MLVLAVSKYMVVIANILGIKNVFVPSVVIILMKINTTIIVVFIMSV